MKQAILQLKQKRSEFNAKKEDVINAIDALQKISMQKISMYGQYYKEYDKLLNILAEESILYYENIKSIDKTLLALQKVCDHKNPDGTSAFVIFGNSETILQTKKCEICNLLIKV